MLSNKIIKLVKEINTLTRQIILIIILIIIFLIILFIEAI